MPSVLQPWVMELDLRHQGVIVSAMRGCDIAPRHDPSKIAQRLLRGAVLETHVGKYGNPKTYIIYEQNAERWWELMKPFIRNWDHYPNHYVVHFMHAVEIIGYHGPDAHPVYKDRWEWLYKTMCLAMHVNCETQEQLDRRLSAPEDEFNAAQDAMEGGVTPR